MIRRAEPADADAIAGLLTELGHPISPTHALAFLQSLTGRPTTSVFVAASTSVLGVIAGQLLSVISDPDPVLMITALSISSASRRGGAGRALVGALEAWGRQHGAKRVLVTTALHRDGAHAFYERLGYSFSGRRYGRAL